MLLVCIECAPPSASSSLLDVGLEVRFSIFQFQSFMNKTKLQFQKMRNLLLLLSLFISSSLSEKTKRPNVIMFFVDDLGYGDMGFTGHPSTKVGTISDVETKTRT